MSTRSEKCCFRAFGREGGFDFAWTLLNEHNRHRAAVGAPALKWSNALARDAQQWADHLSSTGTLTHSTGNDQGENLWMGTAHAYSYERMVESWASERRDFEPGVFRSGIGRNAKVVGHYTQMIWRDTTHVGGAMATAGGFDYLVCRYSPPGNVIGAIVP
jgi:uncharacterized protein YkwD